MIRRLFMIAAAAASLGLAACGGSGEEGGANGGGKRQTINFSILSTENSRNLEALWRPFIADMEAQTGLEVKPYFGSNYTALIEAMRAGQVQVGWFSNNSGLQAVRRADAEVFARSTDPSGEDGYQSVVIVRDDSPITVEDLLRCGKRHTFGMGDVQSTSGTLAPLTYFFGPRNIDPQRCFRTVRSANHEGNLLSVANGVLDAATNNTTNIKRLARSQPQLAERVKVIWRSPTIPEDPIVWRKDLDPAVKERVRQFFLTYGAGQGADAERQRKILTNLDFGVFQPANDSHLIPVREMEATQAVIQARNAGDQAKLTAAQRELDKVRAERVQAEARAGAVPAS